MRNRSFKNLLIRAQKFWMYFFLLSCSLSPESKAQRLNQVKLEFFNIYNRKYEFSYERNFGKRYGIEAIVRFGNYVFELETGLSSVGVLRFPSYSLGYGLLFKKYMQQNASYMRGYMMIQAEREQLLWVEPKYKEYYLARLGSTPKYNEVNFMNVGIGTGIKFIFHNGLVVEPLMSVRYNFLSDKAFPYRFSSLYMLRAGYAF